MAEQKFGELLRKIRKNQKRTQTDVAKAIGMSTAYVCDIEKGRRGHGRMDPMTLIKWADYLNYPINKILIYAGMIDKDYDAKYGTYMRILRSKVRAQRVGFCIDNAKNEIENLKNATEYLPTAVVDSVKALESRILELEICLTHS